MEITTIGLDLAKNLSLLEQIRGELVGRRIRASSGPAAGDTEGRGTSPGPFDSCHRDRVVQGALKLILEPIGLRRPLPGSAISESICGRPPPRKGVCAVL